MVLGGHDSLMDRIERGFYSQWIKLRCLVDHTYAAKSICQVHVRMPVRYVLGNSSTSGQGCPPNLCDVVEYLPADPQLFSHQQILMTARKNFA